MTVAEGHVLITDEGNLVASKGFKVGVVDPVQLPEAQPPMIQEEEELPPLEEGNTLDELYLPEEGRDSEGLNLEPSTPDRRLREKTTVRFLEGELHKDTPESRAQLLLLDEDFSDAGFRKVVTALEEAEVTSTDRRGDFEGRFVLGAYCHGGQRGVTTLCKNHPSLTRYLNKFLRTRLGTTNYDAEWSAILLMHASDVPTHRDFRNEWGTKNYVLCVPGTVDLWIGPPHHPKTRPQAITPDWESQDVLCITNEVRAFDPRGYHAVRKNPDWVIVGYSPLGVLKLNEVDKDLLKGLGFRVPMRFEEEHQVKVVRQHQESTRAPEQSASSNAADQNPLAQDEQPDTNTTLVGWDLSEGARRNQPTGDSLPRDLQLFLWERDIEYLLPELQRLGIEEREDLIYLFEEDLLEFGLTRSQAARVLFGVHPAGTRRPDNPNTCGLRTGEVRLFDRESRQIPWVMQNRTLAQSSPDPPLPNLGVRISGVEPSSSSRSWQEVEPDGLEHADHYEDEVLQAQPAASNIPLDHDPPPWDVPAHDPPPWEIPSCALPADLPTYEEEPAPEPVTHVWEDEWTPSNMPAGYGSCRWQDTWHPSDEVGFKGIWEDSWIDPAAASSADHFGDTTAGSFANPVGIGPDDRPVDGSQSHPTVAQNADSAATVASTGITTPSEVEDQVSQPSLPYPPGLGFSDDSEPSICMVQMNEALRPGALDVPPPTLRRVEHQECVASTIGVHFPPVISATAEDMMGPTDESVVAKVVETSYTPDIEQLLSNLSGPLEVVHQVAPADVRGNLDKWRSAAQEELNSLVNMKAIKRHKGVEAQQLLRNSGIETIPAKCVFTVKPGKPYRRKVRIVSCGNYAQGVSEDVLYASGAAAETLRAVLVRSGQRRYSAWSTDIKNAFLLAPIPNTTKKRYALRPPDILIQLGIVEPGEVWEVCRALYGFKEAPKWWAQFRDQVLETTRFRIPAGEARLKRITSDENLWMICLANEAVVGYVLVYVDDLLILSSAQVANSLHEWIKRQWQCSDLERAHPGKALRFLGIDIFEVQDEGGPCGFALGQEGYIDELVRSHALTPSCKANIPVPKEWVREVPCEEAGYSEAALRDAQRVTGELLWVSQRTRVDISFSVGLMSSWVTRSPTFVSKLGLRILAYLANTKRMRLCLVPKDQSDVEVFTDASFAPYSEKSISGIVVQLAGRCVFWKSRRQSIVSLSTAECLLIAACEGVVLAQSIQALASELLNVQSKIVLKVDNVAAITLAEGGGSQRTRHLRARANFLKEMIDNNQLTVNHCPGERQLADTLTKALPAPRLELLNELLGISSNSFGDPLISSVATTSRAFRGLDSREGQGMILIMALLMVQLQPVTSQDDDEGEPVDLDLYLVAVMMACSVLFVWEVGKHCFRHCMREPTAQVASVRSETDVSRRTRRQQAVRRALERETRESSDRAAPSSTEEATVDPVSAPSRPSTAPHVHLHVTAPVASRSENPSTSSTSAPAWTSVRPPTPPIPDPPPPPPGTRRVSEGQRGARNSREVGVQTSGPPGLSDAQLCEMELITSSARTPGVLHIFPNCHVLRTVQGTHRRTFCRYCLWTLRQQGNPG